MAGPKYNIPVGVIVPAGLMPNPQVFLPPSMRSDNYDLAQKIAEALTPSPTPESAPAAPPAPAEEPPPPTASEGLHPLAISPEEGLPAAPLEQIVKQLLKLLKLKYTAVILYMNYGDRLRAHYRDAIYDHFQEHIEDERNDAYALAMKITALGAEPTPKVGQVPDTADLHQMLIVILKAEQELQGEARQLCVMAGDNTGLRLLGERLVEHDAHHADDMRRLMGCEVGL